MRAGGRRLAEARARLPGPAVKCGIIGAAAREWVSPLAVHVPSCDL
jgi:hypothetical protein